MSAKRNRHRRVSPRRARRKLLKLREGGQRALGELGFHLHIERLEDRWLLAADSTLGTSAADSDAFSKLAPLAYDLGWSTTSEIAHLFESGQNGQADGLQGLEPSDLLAAATAPQSVQPAGSLVYATQESGGISVGGEVDSYTIDLDAGQKLTVLAEPDGTLQPVIEVLSPGGGSLGTMTAAAAGSDAVLQSLPVASTGSYVVTVTGYAGTTGAYEVQIVLNAAVEAEEHSGIPNDSLATAQDLDATFVGIGVGVADRGAVIGSGTDGIGVVPSPSVVPSEADVFYNPTTGELFLDSTDAPGGVFTGYVLATNENPGFIEENHIPFLNGVGATTDGELSEANFFSSAGLFNIGAVMPTDLDQAGLEAFFSTSSIYSGALGTGISNFDFIALDVPQTVDHYRFSLTAGQSASLSLARSGGGDIAIELLDSAGNLLTDGANADNADRVIADFVAPSAGSYYVRVTSNVLEYALVVTRDAVFNMESNDSVADAQTLGVGGVALGAVDGDVVDGDDDYYRFDVVVGDVLSLETATPSDGPFEFANNLDPALALHDPSGTLVAFDNNGAADGHNSLLTHTALQTGTYTVRVAAFGGSSGEYVLEVSGQTGVPAAFEVTATNPADGVTMIAPFGEITVHLSDRVVVSSVDAGDLTVDGVAATAVTILDADTLQFTLPALADGLHDIEIAAGALFDLQNQPLAAFASQFTLDTVGPRVISTSIQEGDSIAAGLVAIAVQFDRELNGASLDPADVQLLGSRSGSHSPTTLVYDALTSTLQVTYDVVPDDAFTLTLVSGNGAFEDLAGRDLDGEPQAFPLPGNVSGDGVVGGNFVVNFVTDQVALPLDVPLQAVEPLGSLVYEGMAAGVVRTAGDVDSFTVDVDDGQVVTVVLDGDSSLQAAVELLAPGGASLDTATASVVDGDAVLQTVPTVGAGTYQINVSGVGSTTGEYELHVVLNAAVEEESHGGPANDSLATAEDLDSRFVALGPGVTSRAAVLGSFDAGTDFVASETQFDTISHPNDLVFEFEAVPLPTGNGVLTLTALADLNLEVEFLTVNAEDVLTTNLFMTGGLQGESVSASIEIAQADLQTLSADGLITIAIDPSSWVNQLSQGELTVELSYPTYPAGADVYQFDLLAGELASLALSSTGPGYASLELLDPVGNVLTTGAVGANVDQVVDSFVATAAGTYYARVSGDVAEYNLVVARGADFDTEGNNGLASAAQDLTASSQAFGGLFAGDVEPALNFGLIQDSLPWSVASNNAILEELGHNVTTISSWDLDTIDLSAFDVVVLASDQSGIVYGNVEDNIAAIESYVAGGGVWVVNYAAAKVDFPYSFDVLPGADGFEVQPAAGPDINVVDPASGLIVGPGGTIDDTTLDGGFWSHHGSTTSTLPGGGNGLLSTDDPTELVAFEYPLGSGFAVVHTIPLEFYEGGPSTIGKAFHRNLFNYAAELASGIADYYSVEVVGGDVLDVEVSLPAAGPFEFVNDFDVAVELYDPAGVLVASSATGDLSHATSVTGTYTVKVVGEADSRGEYVVNVSGYSGSLPLFEVAASDPGDAGRVGVDTIDVTIDLSDAVLLTSVVAADLIVDGSISALSVSAVDHDTLVFELPALSDGLHTMEIAAGALTDLQGQPLETFSSSFTVDTIAPRVISTSVTEGDVVSARSLVYVVQFDEELAAESLSAFDLQLVGQQSGGHLPLMFDYAPSTSMLTLEYINLPEDEFSLTLLSGDGLFEDLVGHDLDGEANDLTTVPSGDGEAGGNFVVDFTNEYIDVPLPSLLHAQGPRGALIYDTTVTGTVGISGDVDSFIVDVDAGQRLSVVVESDGTLQAGVSIEDPFSTTVASASAVAAGDDVVIQTVAAPTAGTYTIRLTGAAATTGDYSLFVVLNAAVEEEAYGGSTNDTILSSQDLEASFIGIGRGTAERGAVLGQGGADADLYRFELAAAESATLALTARLADGVSLELLDAGGIVVATGAAASGGGIDRVIDEFVAATAGTYFARIVGAESEYSLVVTRGAGFDVEANDSIGSAQSIGSDETALGYLLGEPIAEVPETPAGLLAAEGADDPLSIFDRKGNKTADSVPGRLIVRFQDFDNLDVAETVSSLGGTLIRELPLIDAALVAVPLSLLRGTSDFNQGWTTTGTDSSADTASLLALADDWAAHEAVLYAEPDYVLQTQTVPFLPNDLNTTALWGMHNVGQTGGTVDADIDAPEAWANFTGSTQVVVASIDTGVDYTHEDLAANMWRNLAEVNGTPGVDDDGNGFVDDIYGIDTANDDSDPFDDEGHGTHTAGTFGGVGNNGVGIVGVNWDVQVMALKFLGANGNGSTSDAIDAIDYMTMMKTDHGVNIVASNNSWSGGAYSESLRDAIEASNEAGIMFVAAAGNLASDNDAAPEYPSAFDLEGIISVAATDDNDELANFSNFGATAVDLAAPGVFIWSAAPGDSYVYNSGTSMAAPHVAGAVAMLMAANPDASLAEVKEAILSGVDPVASLNGFVSTGGRLNLANSLALLGDEGDFYQIDVVAGDALYIGTATPGAGPFEFANDLDPFVELYDPSGTLVGANDNGAGDGVNVRMEHTAIVTGTYTVRVASSAGAGSYIVDVAVAPRIVGVEVNDKPHLSVSSIEGAARGITTIDVQFSRPVEVTTNDILVQAVTFAGDDETVTGTLTPLSVAGSGSAALTLSFAEGTVVDTWVRVTLLAGGIVSTKDVALDGDAPASGSGRGFLAEQSDMPSGDGASGGDGVFIVGSLIGDTNGDGRVAISHDILPAFTAFTGNVGAAGGRTVADGDIDEDGDVDVSDLMTMFVVFGNELDSLPSLWSPASLLSPLMARESRQVGDAIGIRNHEPSLNAMGASPSRTQTVDVVYREAGANDELSPGDVLVGLDEGDEDVESTGIEDDLLEPLAADDDRDSATVDVAFESW